MDIPKPTPEQIQQQKANMQNAINQEMTLLELEYRRNQIALMQFEVMTKREELIAKTYVNYSNLKNDGMEELCAPVLARLNAINNNYKGSDNDIDKPNQA